MVKEEFEITSKDEKGTKVHCVKWMPDEVAAGKEKPAFILQIVHGMTEYVERYEAFASWLNERNVLVTGEDHLGHGKTAKGEEDLGYFCEKDPATVVVEDVHTLRKTTEEQYSGVPYFILGHSMGSFITRNYICRHGEGLKGAIIMGTGMTPLSLLKFSKTLVSMQEKIYGGRHTAKMINSLAFSGYTKGYENAKTGFEWLTVDEENIKRYVADPLCGFTFKVNGFKTLFELLYRLHDKEALAKMPKDLPVLFISGKDDPVGECGKTVEEVYNSFVKEYGLKDVSLKLIPGARHEILKEKTVALEAYEFLYEWLTKRA